MPTARLAAICDSKPVDKTPGNLLSIDLRLTSALHHGRVRLTR